MAGVKMKAHTVALASDHAGFELKESLKSDIVALGFAVEDLGPHDTASVDYPDYANKMADWLKTRQAETGILICGSGIGISIAANRHKHIRAALCSDGLSARLSRQHNNANVLCLGARLIGRDMAKECVTQFLTTAFEAGRHAKRVEKLG
jgi:ribose 5-phosphate isomerase B